MTAIIHIVDDDESFRSATGELLSACGYKVQLYETAKKLLETPLSGTLLVFCWIYRWQA